MSEPAETADQATIPEFLLVPYEGLGPDPRRFYAPLLAAGILFGLFDFFLAPTVRALGPANGFVLVFLGFAVLGAQASLIAIWGVIAPVSLLTRAFVTGILLFTFFWCWMSGFALSIFADSSPEMFIEMFTVIIGGTPIILLAIQLPLWIGKVWSKWEVVYVPKPSDMPRRRLVTIKDMLLATAVVAAALAIARVAGGLLPTMGAGPDEFMVGLGITASSVALWSFAVMLPLVVLILQIRRWEYGLAGVIASYVATSAVILLVVVIVTGLLPSNSQLAATLFSVGSYYLITGAGLAAARMAGFRVQRAN